MLTSWGRCILGVSRPSILFNATCFAPFRYLSTVQCRPYLHLPHHYIPCWISAFHCSPTVQAGHNKWSKIKHKKTAADSERSKVISKHSSRIVAAVRAGGSANADLNDRLMSVISDARDAGLSKSNIENALRSGNSSSRSQAAEPVLYEGRGPSGYSILIEAVTDNRNRTRPEIRTMLEKHGGSLGEPGSSSFMFEHKGLVRFLKEEQQQLHDLLELAIEVGAEDVAEPDTGNEGDDCVQLKCRPNDLKAVVDAIEGKGITISSATLEYLPTSVVTLDGVQYARAVKLYDLMSDHNDVTDVYVNFVCSGG